MKNIIAIFSLAIYGTYGILSLSFIIAALNNRQPKSMSNGPLTIAAAVCICALCSLAFAYVISIKKNQ